MHFLVDLPIAMVVFASDHRSSAGDILCHLNQHHEVLVGQSSGFSNFIIHRLDQVLNNRDLNLLSPLVFSHSSLKLSKVIVLKSMRDLFHKHIRALDDGQCVAVVVEYWLSTPQTSITTSSCILW